MESIFDSSIKTNKYIKNYFFVTISLVLIITGIIAFNAAFSNENLVTDTEQDERIVNPKFTLQHYFYFNDIDLSEENCNKTEPHLSVVDTSNGGTGAKNGGKLPTNEHETSKCILLEKIESKTKTLVEGEKYKIKTKKVLVPLFQDEKTDYQTNPRMKYMDRLYNNMDDYNENYTLSEVWVLKDSKDSETDKTSTNQNDWDIYKVPKADGTKHNPDAIMFTNNEHNSNISKKEDGTITSSNDGYTILIKENSVIRLVYETVETKEYEKTDVNFFDYNISDGNIYTTNSQSDPKNTSSQNDSQDWYAYTKEAGINSADNYSGNGAKYAFGNTNAGSNRGDEKHGEYYINRYNSKNPSGSSYGLVKNNQLSDEHTPIWNEGITGPDLFGKKETKGKVSYTDNQFSMIFDRIGGTFILSEVKNNKSNNNNKKTLDDLENFKITYQNSSKTIYSNEFWPMDLADSWGSNGNDMKFGSSNLQTKRRYFGATNNIRSYLPISDCGEDHNPYFGVSFQSEFTIDPGYSSPLDFFFFGDDDFWLFLEKPDGTVVQIADIGGVHSSVGQYVNLWDYVEKIPYTDENGNLNKSSKKYKLYFFYTERGASGSTLYMRFTIPLDAVKTHNQDASTLIIGKEVKGIEPNKDEKYKFKIELQEKVQNSEELKDNEDLYIYKIFNRDETEDGGTEASSGVFDTSNKEFELANNQYLVLYGVPDTISFKIEEEERPVGEGEIKPNRRISVKTTHREGTHDHLDEEKEGRVVECSIANANYVQFFNSYTGIIVTKTAFGEVFNDKEFDFTVTLSDKTINGKYGDMEFTNGVATFKLKSGGSISAANLPEKIQYTVEEIEKEEDGELKVKKVNATGETAYGTIHEVEIYNYYEKNLKLEKKVIGKGAENYKFRIDLNIDERIREDNYNYKVYKNGQTTETATKTIPSTGGEITLKDGEYIVIEGLPTSTTYTIEELEAETSKTTYCKSLNQTSCTEEFNGQKVTNEKLDETDYVRFTNSYSGLTITKKVIGTTDKDKTFNFTMTLGDTSVTGKHGDFEFTNGVAKFTLTNGETKQTSSLPENTTYTITEDTEEGYKTIKVGDTGTTSYEDINVVEFYNYKTTKLKVEKEALGLPESVSKDYEFTLTLKDLDEHLKNETATYKKYDKDNKEIESSSSKFTLSSELTFSLKSGEYIVIEDLPDGTAYELKEKDSGASKVYYFKGKIETNSESIESNSTDGQTVNDNLSTNNYIKFVNSYAGLTVHKSVIGTNGDHEKEFVFTVTLDNKDINGTFGEMSFKNGIATFTLKHDQSKTAYGLPENVGYKVEEQAEDDYSATSENATGTIESQKITTVKFYNYLTKRLKVEKEIIGTVADKDTLYQFTFVLNNPETGYPEEYKYIKYDKDNNIIEQDKTIKSNESFNLKGSEYVIIEGLPDNAQVKVTENIDKVTKVTTQKGTIKNGLDEDETDGKEITVSINENNYIKFNNKYASLSVKKIILGKPEEMKKKFKFTVTLTGNEEINGKYGDMEFTNGKAEFELTNEEIKIASGLPEGTTYTVTENNQEGFQTIKTNDTGTLKLGETNEVVFINYTTGDIRIEKEVEGKEATKDQEYTFRINFTSDVENADIKKTYSYTKYDKDKQEIKPDTENPEESTPSNTLNDGDTFTLKAGEYIVLHDVEAGTKVTIEEINPKATKVTISTSGLDVEDVYETEIDGHKVTAQTPYVNYIKFTNNYGGIDITKEVNNVRDDDKDKEFTFTITLNNKNINGTYGDFEFKDGVATFTLKHGETKYTSGLPEGTTYEIVEQSTDGYKSYSEENTGTIVAGEQQKVDFTNLRVLDLRIEKEVRGLAIINSKNYDFNLHLNTVENEMYAKEYQYKKYNQNDEEIGEGTFTIGDNSFSLQNGEYIVVKDLPEILNYELQEETNSNSSTDYIIGTTFAGLTENISLGNEYKNDVSSINRIKFINKYASIKITKTVTGPAADYNREYKFTITLDDSSINGTYGDLTFKDGVAHFTLKNKETKYANALPENVSYEVTEEPLEGYTVTYKGEKGVTRYGTINEVEFTNKRTLIDYILPPNTGAREIFDKYVIIIINIIVLSIGLIAHAIRKMILKAKKA